MTQDEADARVARGAAVLDTEYPEGWADRINLKTLKIANCCACVLRQVEGSFETGLERLFGGVMTPCNEAAAQHGFVVLFKGSVSDVKADYDILQAAWVQAITARLAPAVTWTHRDSTKVTT